MQCCTSTVNDLLSFSCCITSFTKWSCSFTICSWMDKKRVLPGLVGVLHLKERCLESATHFGEINFENWSEVWDRREKCSKTEKMYVCLSHLVDAGISHWWADIMCLWIWQATAHSWQRTNMDRWTYIQLSALTGFLPWFCVHSFSLLMVKPLFYDDVNYK